jgi:pre-60S factor REI1
MKRRVAGLPPVSATLFNQKVQDRKAETAVAASGRGATCELCRCALCALFLKLRKLTRHRKTYTTENAYRSHLASKKHRDTELQAAIRLSLEASAPPKPAAEPEAPTDTKMEVDTPSPAPAPAGATLKVDADADSDAENDTIDAKIAASRARLAPTACLFCPVASSSIDANLAHMGSAHSFFIPDADYLVDLPGLLRYLGEKVAVGNVCVYCNGRGREFRTLAAVRKHMIDRAHTKLAYESQRDQLELADFYDFRSSYPDALTRVKKRRNAPRVPDATAEAAAEAEWEDVEDDGEADEVVSASGSGPAESDDDDKDSDDDALPENPITYGDTPYELVLASGARIGHRAMRRYYAQNLPTRFVAEPDPNSGAARVRALLADKGGALVPTRGGFGAFGQGAQVVKARNRGEAREAGRHTREHRDQDRKRQYATRVAYKNNSQKHFRDPLLQ